MTAKIAWAGTSGRDHCRAGAGGSELRRELPGHPDVWASAVWARSSSDGPPAAGPSPSRRCTPSWRVDRSSAPGSVARRGRDAPLPWPVMSYIAGPSLQEAVTDRGPLPPGLGTGSGSGSGSGRAPSPPVSDAPRTRGRPPTISPVPSGTYGSSIGPSPPPASKSHAERPDASTGPRFMGCSTYQADILTGTAPLDQCGKRDERDHRWLIFSAHDELPQRRHS
jgi:hypothetical protein